MDDLPANLKQYADNAFLVQRQKIESAYLSELGQAKAQLVLAGHGRSSSAWESTELQLKSEKVGKLILARAECLLEAYEDHELPIDLKTIMKDVALLSAGSAAGAASSYTGQVTLKALRTGAGGPAGAAMGASFRRALDQRTHAAMNEARHLVEKRTLAQNRKKDSDSRVHNEYHLYGDNSRLNFESTDRSVNVKFVGAEQVFEKLRIALEEATADGAYRTEVLQHLKTLEEAQGKPHFAERLGKFLAIAANSVTIISPFLPALSEIAHKAM